MFYSLDILQKRGGKFGVVWLAATKMAKLSKREIAGVHITRKCEDILEYIMGRVVNVHGKRTCFSLYLSANLMYGCACIHQKHCDYLLSDAKTALLRLTTSTTFGQNINLLELPRPELVTNPDVLELDGDFAVFDLPELKMDDILEYPLSTESYWNLDESPRVDSSSKRGKRGKKRKEPEPAVDVNVEQHVSRNEDITLKEPESATRDMFSAVPKEQDLQPLNAEQLADLMGITDPTMVQPDFNLPTVDSNLPTMESTQGPQELGLIDRRDQTLGEAHPTSTPFTSTSKRRRLHDTQTALESPILPQAHQEQTPARGTATDGEFVVPAPRTVPLSPGVTQQILNSPLPAHVMQGRELLELELTVLTPSPATRKRRLRKQLVFADAETQIPRQAIKENMQHSKDTCHSFAVRDVQGQDAESLLKMPANSVLNRAPLAPLWSRSAKFRTNLAESQLAQQRTPPQELNPNWVPREEPSLPNVEMPLRAEAQDQSSLAVPELSLLQAQLSPVVPQTETRGSSIGRSQLEQSVEELRRIGSMSESRLAVGDTSMLLIEESRDVSGRPVSSPVPVLADTSAKSATEDSLLDTGRQSRRGKKRGSQVPTSRGEEMSVLSDPGLSASSSHHSTSTRSRTLYDVIEEPQFPTVLPELGIQLDGPADNVDETFYRALVNSAQQTGSGFTTFRSVCALEDRKSAATKFMALLQLCRRHEVRASQDVPYGDIYITIQE